MASLPLQLESKIVRKPNNGCWEWTGCKIQNGYGRVHTTPSYKVRKMVLAHRAVYELLRGAIPEGMTLDHLCRNRACVNPDHLEPVDLRTNVLRGVGPTAINARKTHCPKGHPLVWNGHQRVCKTCTHESQSARYELNKNSGPLEGKPECGKGHKFTPENTLLHGGSQHCRECAKERMRKFKERHAKL